MTTIHNTSQAAPALWDLPGNRGAALNRLDDGGDRVVFQEPDSLADDEWPPVELVLDHYEACLGGGSFSVSGGMSSRPLMALLGPSEQALNWAAFLGKADVLRLCRRGPPFDPTRH